MLSCLGPNNSGCILAPGTGFRWFSVKDGAVLSCKMEYVMDSLYSTPLSLNNLYRDHIEYIRAFF